MPPTSPSGPVGVTALTYGGTKIMQRLVILYGKRLFAVLYGNQTLGFIVPGLIAYLPTSPPAA